MSSAVCGVESPQPKDVVEDTGQLKEDDAAESWKEKGTGEILAENIHKNDGIRDEYQEVFKGEEEETTTVVSKGEDNFVTIKSNTKENQSALNEPTPISTEEKCSVEERKAESSDSSPQEKNENLELHLENSGGFIEKGVDWMSRTADVTSPYSYPVGTVSLTSYSPSASLFGQESAKRIPYCYATQPSFIGIPGWISSQTSNPTNSDIHPELASLHSYQLSNDIHAVDEEARSASLVLLKLKSVTAEGGFELPPFRRKKWKKENVAYSQNKEDRRWSHRTFAKDMECKMSNAVDADATYRAWKRSKRSHESGVIPPQTEVACRVKEEDSNEWSWVLGIVDSYSNSSGQYRIIDIEELGNEQSSQERYYFVSPDNVIPLSNDTKHVLPAETRVLAIYPDTTVFYPATIRSSRKTGKQLYYALEFDDEDEDEEIVKHVPARYVIIIPE